jgi:hypothetical protein
MGSGEWMETQRRVDRAEELLCSGISSEQVQRIMAGPPRWVNERGAPSPDGVGINIGGYNITKRQVRNYIEKAHERWRESSGEERIILREKYRRAAERKSAKAEAQGQLGPSIRALELAAKIGGVLTDKIELTGPNGGPLNLTVASAHERVRARLEKLAKKT